MTLKNHKLMNGIIVCPASVAMVWKDECEKFDIDCHTVKKSKDIGSGLNIISYGSVKKYLTEFNKHKFKTIICDEAHFLKNKDSIRTNCIYGENSTLVNSISEHAEIFYPLTGTPMPNNPSELWSTLRAVVPETLRIPNGYMDFDYFLNRYCKYFYKRYYSQYRLIVYDTKNLDDLKERLKGWTLRRKKAEVLKDLPPITYASLPVEGNYKSLGVSNIKLFEQCINSSDPLVELERLSEHNPTLRKNTGLLKVEPVKQWIKESSHEKIAVYAYHTDVIDQLRTIKDSVYIYGKDNSLERRTEAVQRFQNGDARVFIGQIDAAGTGITITAANVILLVECSYRPCDNRQVADRIYRIGQTKSCIVYFVCIAGSFDEQITNIVKRKTRDYKKIGL